MLPSFKHFLFQIGVINISDFELLSNENSDASDLIKHNILTEKDFSFLKSQWLDISSVNLDEINIARDQLPKSIATEYKAVILETDSTDQLQIALANPVDFSAQQKIQQSLNKFDIQFHMACFGDLAACIESYAYENDNLNYLGELVRYESQVGKNINQFEGSHFTSSISEIFNSIVNDAVNRRATDIHIQYNNQVLEVLLRIVNKLNHYSQLAIDLSDSLRQHIFLIGRADIAKLNLPQDFQFENVIDDKQYGYRCSYLPTRSGYSIVIRIQHADVVQYSLDDILVDNTVNHFVKKQLNTQQGLFLVTGPTGSGKTTLLYAMLRYLAEQYHLKILTMEDPVETTLPFANQVQIEPEKGLDFQDVIRVSLRQNPDVLLIGEIRDPITAKMAVRAAMTGIMVFASLHTSEPKHSLARLINLGVEPIDLSTGIRMAIGSKIIPKLCQRCKQVYEPNDDEMKKIKHYFSYCASFWVAKGCIYCGWKGVKGYINFSDMIFFNKEVKQAISLQSISEVYQKIEESREIDSLLSNLYKAAQEGKVSFSEFYNQLIVEE
jgi:type II secretory ATPase GspE/PulE/Tfp pilus assembly ATPase PilB-like protein